MRNNRTSKRGLTILSTLLSVALLLGFSLTAAATGWTEGAPGDQSSPAETALVSSSTTVNDEYQLAATLQNPLIDTINIGAGFSIGTTQLITRPITINGGGHTLVPSSATRMFSIVGPPDMAVAFNNLTLAGAAGGAGPEVVGARLTLTGVTLRNFNVPAGGAALQLKGGSLSTTSTIFSSNRSANRGGAIWAENASLSLGAGTVVNDNSAPLGGGLYLDNSTATLAATAVTNNQANTSGGGIYAVQSSMTLNGQLDGNGATADGGGLYQMAGARSAPLLFLPNGGNGYFYQSVPYRGSVAAPSAVSVGISHPGEDSFTGWNTEPDGSGTVIQPDDPILNIQGLVLYAQWQAAQKSIVYQSNGGNGGPYTESTGQNDSYTVKSDTDVGFSRPGYSFAGWNTADDGSGVYYAPGTVYSLPSNLTLYAQWTPDSRTVTYHPNGATPGSEVIEVVGLGESYNIKPISDFTFDNPGFDFNDWNTQPDGSGVSYTPGYELTVTDDVTLWAQWAPVVLQSEPPTIDRVLEYANDITGFGVPGAEIIVFFPSGLQVVTTVEISGFWHAPVNEPLFVGDVVIATQTEPGKTQSEQVQTIILPTSRRAPAPIPASDAGQSGTDDSEAAQQDTLSQPTDEGLLPASANQTEGDVSALAVLGALPTVRPTALATGTRPAGILQALALPAGPAGASTTITGGSVQNNTAGDYGGGIYTDSYRALAVRVGVVFGGNDVGTPSMVDPTANPADFAIYRAQVAVADYGFSAYNGAPLRYGYNNFDINYAGGVTPPTTYTVNFNATGGSPTPATQYVAAGERVAAPESVTRVGHSFAGWFTQTSGGSQWRFATDTVSGSMTLYAHWNPDPPPISSSSSETSSSSSSSSSSPSSTSSSNSQSTSSSSSTSSNSSSRSSSSTSSSSSLINNSSSSSSSSRSSSTPSSSRSSSNSSSSSILSSISSSSSGSSSGNPSSSLPLDPPSSGGSTPPTPPPNSTVPTPAETLEELRQEGVPIFRLGDNEVPLYGFGGKAVWSLLNLILTLLSLAVSVLMLLLLLPRRRSAEGAEDGQSVFQAGATNPSPGARRRRYPLWVSSVLLGVLAMVLFLVTQNLNYLMVLIDGWSWLFGLAFAAQVVLAVLARGRRPTSDANEDGEGPAPDSPA